MALTNFQVSSTPAYTDQPFMNYGSSDIPAGRAVTVDATNQAGSGTNAGIGVAVIASTGDPTIGVTMETMKAGAHGRVRCLGAIASCLADGAITAGTYVDASAAGGKVGYVKAHAAGKSVLGIALASASSDGDPVPVMLTGGIGA